MTYQITIERLDNCLVVSVNTHKEVFGTEPAGAYPESPEARTVNSVCKMLNRANRLDWEEVPINPTSEAIPAGRNDNYSRVVVSLEHGIMTLLAWTDGGTAFNAADLREAYASVDAVRRRLEAILPVQVLPKENEAYASAVDVTAVENNGSTIRFQDAESVLLVVRDRLGVLSLFELGAYDRRLSAVADTVREDV